MKIGINGRFLSIGFCGNHTYLANLLYGLEKYDKKNEYVVFVNNETAKHTLNINADNIKFIVIDDENHNMKGSEWDFNFVNTKEFKDENIDILHCTHFAVPKIKNKNIKIITSIHDLIPSRCFRIKAFIEMGCPFNMLSTNGLVMRFKEAKMIKNADYVITFSDYVKKDVLRFFTYPDDKISVIPHFPSSVFRIIKDKEKLIETKNKYNLPDRFILYFSGYHTRKNIQRLIKSFKQITKERNDIYLVFVGLGKLKDKIEKKNLKNVIFTGKITREELARIINLSEFSVAPSLLEGFGLWVVETMKCGKICLTSENSPMQEIGGDATIYFNPKDTDEIYEKMLTIINNPELRRELEDKARERVKLFTEERHIKDTISIYGIIKYKKY